MIPNYFIREACAICHNKKCVNVADYGDSPLAGNFLLKDELGTETKYPLSFMFCKTCALFQTSGTISPDVLFKDYRYSSSVGLAKYFEEFSNYLVSTFSLNHTSKTLDIGSNDGVMLVPLMQKGIDAYGIDPAVNINKIAIDKGCNVINDYFNEDNAKKYFKKHEFDVITCTNCFAHIDDIHTIIRGVRRVLKENGHFVIEVHYVKNLIDQMQWDNAYAEHQYYYSLHSLSYLFNMHNMVIVDFEEIPVHAGSIRVVVKNSPGFIKNHVLRQYEIEKQIGLDCIEYFEEFSDKITSSAGEIQELISRLKDNGNKIIGYGASGRATMIAHMAKLNPDLISYIVDESPERHGRYLPGTHIPIYSKEHLDNDAEPPDYIIIFAWNFSRMIIEKLKNNFSNFIIPLPFPSVISEIADIKMDTL